MNYAEVKKKAFRLLSMRNYHSEVLQRKLIEKGCAKELVIQVIDDCKRLGLLSDQEAVLRELKRGLGPRAIEYKLRLKKEEVRKWISPEIQKKRILELLPKLGPREKAFRTLQRKGFDLDIVIELFSCPD